ncbi:elastin [Exaiptasia diaphana]|uniref:Uncharacterized protein n=1 Tax=Exaiptasia diaphana TaxID=2652724 RepID=A0A913XA10_EXADI|nr:elastin [Exaiptasia diaphana]
MTKGAYGVPVAVPAMLTGQAQMPAGANGVPVAVPGMVPGQAQMPAGANGVPVAVPGMVPGQAQMSAPPGAQAIQPSHAQAIRVDMPPVNQGYTVATEGGVQGSGNHDAQAPPLQTKSTDMPPVYQP